MRPVATDDQFSGHRCSVAQCCLDGIRALIEILNASVEAVVGLILGRLVQHIDQVAAQDLEFGDEAVAVKAVTGISARRLPSALIQATPR